MPRLAAIATMWWCATAQAVAQPAPPRTFTVEAEVGPAFAMGYTADVGPAIGAGAGWFVIPQLDLQLRFTGYEASSAAFGSLWLALIEPTAQVWLGDQDFIAVGAGFGHGPVHGLGSGCTAMRPCTPITGWTSGGEVRVGHHFGTRAGFELGAAALRVGLVGGTNVTAFVIQGGYQLF